MLRRALDLSCPSVLAVRLKRVEPRCPPPAHSLPPYSALCAAEPSERGAVSSPPRLENVMRHLMRSLSSSNPEPDLRESSWRPPLSASARHPWSCAPGFSCRSAAAAPRTPAQARRALVPDGDPSSPSPNRAGAGRQGPSERDEVGVLRALREVEPDVVDQLLHVGLFFVAVRWPRTVFGGRGMGPLGLPPPARRCRRSRQNRLCFLLLGAG